MKYLYRISLVFFFCYLSALYALDRNLVLTFESDNLRFYSLDSQVDLSRYLGEKLQHEIDEFQKRIAHYPEEKISVIIPPSMEYFLEIAKKGGEIVEFSEAFYSVKEKNIYLKPASRMNFNMIKTTLLHEYIHFYVHSSFTDAPLWFHEGMAVYFSEGILYEKEVAFALDYLTGNTPSLKEMFFQYPVERSKWNSFYYVSALSIQELYKNSQSFYKLFDLANKDYSFYKAFLHSYLKPVSMFTAEFDYKLKGLFLMQFFMAFPGILWTILPFLLIIAYFKRKFKNMRKYKEELNTEETEVETSEEIAQDETNQEDNKETKQ